MNDTKEVFFQKYCPKCEHWEVDEDHMGPKDPCWDCLDTPYNIDSHKPINFKEADVPEKKGTIKVESYTVSEK